MKVELSFGAAGDRSGGAWCCALNRGRGAVWDRADMGWGGVRPESCEGQCSSSRQQNDNQNIKAQVKSEKEIEQNKPSTRLQLKPTEVERGNG